MVQGYLTAIYEMEATKVVREIDNLFVIDSP
jgi:hypothetical protein